MQFLRKYLVVYNVENDSIQNNILRYEARFLSSATIYSPIANVLGHLLPITYRRWSERLRRSASEAVEALQGLPLQSNVGGLQSALPTSR